jgi:hypothetical protein
MEVKSRQKTTLGNGSPMPRLSTLVSDQGEGSRQKEGRRTFSAAQRSKAPCLHQDTVQSTKRKIPKQQNEFTG